MHLIGLHQHTRYPSITDYIRICIKSYWRGDEKTLTCHGVTCAIHGGHVGITWRTHHGGHALSRVHVHIS